MKSKSLIALLLLIPACAVEVDQAEPASEETGTTEYQLEGTANPRQLEIQYRSEGDKPTPDPWRQLILGFYASGPVQGSEEDSREQGEDSLTTTPNDTPPLDDSPAR